ncbi:MAG: KaiC [Methanoculleus sp. SDB]|nr:MAG: KaiC [Methanoculleus sp. SDB]
MPENNEYLEEIREKRSTGISGLDFQLGGGYPEGTSIVVYGTALTGMDRMAVQFWKAEETAGTYLMLDAAPVEGMIKPSGSDPGTLVPLMEGDRVVVDSLSTVLLEHGIDAAIHCLTDGVDSVRRQGGNVMFLLYSGIHTPLEELRIIRAADIFMTLTETTHGNEIERRLAINKIPHMDVPQRVYPYNVMKEGLEFSTTARVV